MKNYKWLVPLIAFLLIGIAVAAIFKKCKTSPDHSQDNAVVQAAHNADSAAYIALKVIVAAQVRTISLLTDSVQKLNAERVEILVNLATSKNSAVFYRNQISNAVAKNDTILYQSSCDSLAKSFDGYTIQSEKEKENSDQLINAQGKIINQQDTTIKAQQTYIDIAHYRIDTMAQKYASLYSDYLKTGKRSKWQQVKEKGLLGILIAETGYIIISSLKK